MGHMVVELEIMVHNGMVNMIQFEKVLQSPCCFLMLRLDIVHVDRVDSNG